MQLLIKGLRDDYEAIVKALDIACESNKLTENELNEAFGALDNMLNMLILSSTSYQGITSGLEINRQCYLDMQYVKGFLSEQEMKEREAWHWKRIEEQEKLKKQDQ